MRIVSLLPSATEIVCFLGLQEALVAVSHECDYPAGVRELPVVTASALPHDLGPAAIDRAVSAALKAGEALYAVDGVLLERLKPDLIVTQGLCNVCAVSADTVEASLRFLPEFAPCEAALLSLEGKTWGGVLDDIAALARAAGAERQAQTRLEALGARWAALEATKPAARPRAAVLEWTDPPFYGGHWLPEQVEAAGGENVMGEPGQDSGRTSWAELQERDPEVVIVAACGFDLAANLERARALYTHPGARALCAVREGRVWAVDANGLFSRPAPRLVRGAEVLRAIFSGDKQALSAAEAAAEAAWAKPS